MSKKLEKVLEHLIANDQAKAKELLHQVFIEKARKIHEELISQDDLEEMDRMGGDEGDELENDLTSHDAHLRELTDEIDAEETMQEADDEDDLDADLGDDMGDDDMGDDDMDMGDLDSDMDMGDDDMGDDDMSDDMGGEEGGMGDIEDTIGDLEDALAALKAEFEKLEGGDDTDMDDMDDADMDMDAADDDMEDAEDDMDDADMDMDAADDDMEDAEDDEEKMDESWLEEDFDDLAEAIELEKVSVTMGGEVGSGKGQGAPADKSRSPLPASQTSRLGAKPVTTDSKHHSGYNKETAPSSKDMGLNNRRKKADAGMSKVSKEGNGSAMINKTASEFGADTVGKNSILSKAPRK
jgi:hypothetical protein